MEHADWIHDAPGAGRSDLIVVPLWVQAGKSKKKLFYFFQQIVKDTAAEPHAGFNPASEESRVKMESYWRH